MGLYKSTISNEDRCEQCPMNSHTNERGTAVCRCDDGFFRFNSSVENSPCIGKG